MKHLLSIEDLERTEVERIMERAASFAEVGRRDIKKVPTLRGRTIVSLFYESSTRTSSSFELAAKRLSADVVSIKAQGSSVDKGESLRDTIATLTAYAPGGADHPLAVRRRREAGDRLDRRRRSSTPVTASTSIRARRCSTPTRCSSASASLEGKPRTDLEGKRIWIVGDVLHSRVARSCALCFRMLGAEVTLCGPPTLIPRGAAQALDVDVAYTLDDLDEADVVYALRMQLERMTDSFVPSMREYAINYQIDSRRLGPRQLLMHPGPGQPGHRALARRHRRAGLADHRPGRERPRRAHGGPLRAARRPRRAAAAGLADADLPAPTPIGEPA